MSFKVLVNFQGVFFLPSVLLVISGGQCLKPARWWQECLKGDLEMRAEAPLSIGDCPSIVKLAIVGWYVLKERNKSSFKTYG